MRIVASFLGVLLFLLADYLTDTFPTIIIMSYVMDSRIIILPIFLLLAVSFGFILEKKLAKRSG